MPEHKKERRAPRVSAPVRARLKRAFAFHQRGEFALAEAMYRKVLAQLPMQFDALHLLGILQNQKGEHESAVKLMRRAIEINPDHAALHSNIGIALHQLGREEEALAAFDRALWLAPDYAEALSNRGNVLVSLKRPEDALASYNRALELEPDYHDALVNRGSVLLDLKRQKEALADLDRALALAPDHAQALNTRGAVLLELKRPEEALACHDRALQISPDYGEALNNRGNALLELKRPAEALACYDRALQLQPGYVEALNNRGNALLALRRGAEALACYDRALELNPDYAEALNNRGNALLALERREEALACYDRALELNPGYAEAFNNRGNALLHCRRYEDARVALNRALALEPDYPDALNNLGTALQLLDRHEEAAESFARLTGAAPGYDYALGNMFYSRLYCCDWTQYSENAGRIAAAVNAAKRADAPFGFLAYSQSTADQLQCARIFAADKFPEGSNRDWIGPRYQHPRIRVAYLSADFHDHAVAYLTAGLFEAHGRERFEITAISFGPDVKDAMRERLQRSFDRFVDVGGMSDPAVAQMLRGLEIDIAVDLTGYTQNARTGILALRPVPIQVNYLGYPGTMGAGYIDYILADAHVIAPEHEPFYAEKVVYLPDTYLVNDSRRRIAEHTPTRNEAGLPDTGFVFCAFNNHYKIAPDVFDLWMRLLKQVPGSVLWLAQRNAAALRNLRREAETRGVAPERLIFAPRLMNLEDHLARHRLADLFLDTLPYNAHTTASDALWSGLPVLTCTGKTFAGRVAGSLLRAIGLPELITYDLNEYQARALELATTPTLLADIRVQLARNRMTYPLFDTNRFRRHLESAYITMWERHQRGEPPASINVQPIE